jgi:Kef-type K+ transport system membrane component KefB
VKCYITVLKFIFFLSVGFLIQLVLLVERRDIEWIVTLCAIPVSILSLMAGSFVTRRENYYGSIIVMASYDHQSSRSLLMHLGVQSYPTRVLYFQGISHVYS